MGIFSVEYKLLLWVRGKKIRGIAINENEESPTRGVGFYAFCASEARAVREREKTTFDLDRTDEIAVE